MGGSGCGGATDFFLAVTFAIFCVEQFKRVAGVDGIDGLSLFVASSDIAFSEEFRISGDWLCVDLLL